MKPITIDFRKAFRHNFGPYRLLLPTKIAKEIIREKICDVTCGSSVYPVTWVQFINYPHSDEGTEIDTFIGIEEVNVINEDEQYCVCLFFIPAMNYAPLVFSAGIRKEISPWSIDKMSKAKDTELEFYPNHDYEFYPDCDMRIAFKYDKERLTCMEDFETSINKSKRYFRHELTALRFADVEGWGRRSVVRFRNNSGHIQYYAYLTNHTNRYDDSHGTDMRSYLFKKVSKEDVYTNKAIDFFSVKYENVKDNYFYVKY